MRYLLTVLAVALLAMTACGEDATTPPPSPGTTASRTLDTEGFDLGAAPKTEGASVKAAEGRIVTRLPTGACIQTTATPLVIGEYAVFATHKKTPKPGDPLGNASECGGDNSKPGLYAVSLVTGQAYTLMEANAEATAAYVDGTVIQPVLGNGNIVFWRDGKAVTVNLLSAGIDSAGVWDPEERVFVAGTVNSPFAQCQAPVNDDCGAMIAVSLDGKLVRRQDRTGGFRAWVTGGATTDGERYYIGTGTGQEGDSVPGPAAACQVLALSKDFKVEKGYDDGKYQCTSIGKLESAVVGEVPIAGDDLWVQYLGSTNDGPWTPIVRLSRTDLRVLCRTEVPAVPWDPTALYYQAPVIDAEGNAWAVVVNSDNGGNASVIRISPECGRRVLVNTSDSRASTPTLADDRYVLVSWDGKLHVIDRVTGESRDYELGQNEPVIGGAVVSEYGVTVVGESGTVTTFTDTGIKGYGSDPWPRFRKDNHGSAAAFPVGGR